MRQLVSLQARCRWSRLAWNTVLALRVMRTSSRWLSSPMTCEQASRPACAQRGHHLAAVGGAHLQQRAELLVEQRGERQVARAAGELLFAVALEGVDVVGRRVEGDRVEIERDAAVPGEGHLARRGEQAAVGAVVVGEEQMAWTPASTSKKPLSSAGSNRGPGIRRPSASTPARGSSRRGGSCRGRGRPGSARCRRRRCEGAASAWRARPRRGRTPRR